MTRRLLLTTRVDSESGAILALTAVLVPVVLVLTALVVDVGNWYTHQRQLQNRADAAALAAGVEYSGRWPACASDPASEAQITAVARRFAGDPAATGPVNTEVANQSTLDVSINASDYGAADGSDGGGPCYDHPADSVTPAGESNISPEGGTWTDVKVRERNVSSLFGWFGIDLLQVRARARVQLKESIAGDQFVPIAVPEQAIVKAKVLFWNECTGNLITSSVLKPLEGQYQTVGGMTLWGPDPTGTATTVAPGQMSVSLPASVTGCTGNNRDYVPIGVEVRLAGRPDIDLGPDTAARCQQLVNLTSADCFHHISNVRAYEPTGGLSGDGPLVRDVVVSPSGGADGCSPDPYYSRLGSGLSQCRFEVSAYMDWDRRSLLGGTFTATVQAGGGPQATMAGPITQGNWTASGVIDNRQGPSDLLISWEWAYKGPGTWSGQDCSKGKGCDQSGTINVHQVNLADDPSGGDPPSDTIAAVKLTSGPSTTSGEVHSSPTGQVITPYVNIGLKSFFAPGDFAVLRQRSGQRNFSVICDPYWPQPSSQDASAAFYFGCQPPYAGNDTTQNTFWWNTSTTSCPSPGSWFSYSGTPPNVSYPNAPWRCVQLDTGGNGFTIADGIALRTGNCANPAVDAAPAPGAHADCPGSPNSKYVCNNPINYHGGTNFPGIEDRRVVRLYVVPYGAYKNVQSGNGQTVPVLKLAAFYITGWHFNKGDDPCPGNDNAKLKSDELGGYFIKLVDSTGPVDPTRNCAPDDLTMCRPTLVR